MCSASRLVLAIVCGAALAQDAAARPVEAPRGAGELLRVCADPNNLPFSNAKGEGFENRIAKLLAADLDRTLTYTWMPQRRGFVRNTLLADRCDLIMGVPQGYGLTAVTRPYYRSTYVFVTRADSGLDIRSFDDPRLADLRIGVHVIGDDYANPPPAQALADRGLVANVRGYPIYGDYSRPDPTRSLIDAVARDEIDVAVAWGPQVGWFARQEPVALAIEPVADADPGMTFAVGFGFRTDDAPLARDLERELDRRHDEIRRILLDYGVPLVEPFPNEESSS